MFELLQLILVVGIGLSVVSMVLESEVPDDVKMYYSEDLNTPIIGGILLYIHWKNIL